MVICAGSGCFGHAIAGHRLCLKCESLVPAKVRGNVDPAMVAVLKSLETVTQLFGEVLKDSQAMVDRVKALEDGLAELKREYERHSGRTHAEPDLRG